VPDNKKSGNNQYGNDDKPSAVASTELHQNSYLPYYLQVCQTTKNISYNHCQKRYWLKNIIGSAHLIKPTINNRALPTESKMH
jgi:hypothetical protein